MNSPESCISYPGARINQHDNDRGPSEDSDSCIVFGPGGVGTPPVTDARGSSHNPIAPSN
jgi:hypothetical protein